LKALESGNKTSFPKQEEKQELTSSLVHVAAWNGSHGIILQPIEKEHQKFYTCEITVPVSEVLLVNPVEREIPYQE